jgi:5-methylthioadenosine/S-adenosylhomocysteine deaminase
MGMALRGPAFTSADRNAADFAFARELGLPISVHVGMAGTGQMVTALQRHCLLGPDVNYVHGNFLTDAEWDLVAESGGTLTITPSTDGARCRPPPARHAAPGHHRRGPGLAAG